MERQLSDRPAISVLVPAYEAGDFIPTLVESFSTQTMKNFEVVFVDDGSSDNTFKVIEKCVRKYKNLRITFTSIKHIGCAGALKTAVDLSLAPLCTFVGADDWLPDDSLAIILDAFKKNPEVGYLWTRYECKMPSQKKWKEGRSKALPRRTTLKEALLSGWWGALAQDCWRRKQYNKTPGLDPSLPFCVDQQLAMLFANLGCPTAHIPKVTYKHIQHNRQMSALHYKDQQACRKIILERLGGNYKREW